MRTIVLSLTILLLMACNTIETPQHATPTIVVVVTARPPATPTPTPTPTATPTNVGGAAKVTIFEGVRWTCASALLIMSLGGCGSVDQPIPPEISGNQNQWPLPNKDYTGSRSTLDSEISSEKVSELRLAWSFEIPGKGMFGSAATNPLIIDDVVYFQDLGSNVFAIDLKTGHVLWKRIYGAAIGGPNGVAIGWGKVFVPLSGGRIAALSKKTGEEVWQVKMKRTENEFVNVQPSVYDGMVYAGTTTNYLGDATGMIFALDQETGGVWWNFDTVDSKDIWGNRNVNSGGGVWYPPAFDMDRGITYWGIGNPAPWPGTEEFPNGTSRPGPNLYTSSVVALNIKSGKLKWYNQVKPHDLFDHDFQLSPILVTAEVDGMDRDIVIGGGKTGTVAAFDADSGRKFWETKVGVHENSDLTSVPQVVSYEKPWGEPGKPIRVFPGHYGGVETPMAYADGIVYAPVVNLGAWVTPTWSESLEFSEGTGEMVALNVGDGSVLWSTQFDSMVFGAATVVNDLVFTSTFDGMIYALNRETGKEVWSYQAPAGINAWPAVAGDTIIFPAGVEIGMGQPVLIAFRIGATE